MSPFWSVPIRDLSLLCKERRTSFDTGSYVETGSGLTLGEWEPHWPHESHVICSRSRRHVTWNLSNCQDSDYVMKKPSRCWLGAVPRYWKVVASCFQSVSFAENTSAPLAPRARIFQPILLILFSFSCSWIFYKTVSQIFYSVSKFSGVQKKTEFAWKRLLSDVFKYLTNFRFEIWNSETPFFCGRTSGAS